MKKSIYILYSVLVLIFSASCEQELVDNSANPCPSDDPSIICPEAAPVACPPGASAGSADFSKFVALGSSYTAGFQAGGDLERRAGLLRRRDGWRDRERGSREHAGDDPPHSRISLPSSAAL